MTKKTLLVLLLMSLELIHIVCAEMTEGAQEGLLCVHTTDVCIHCTFCLWRNVAVPTLVHILVGPKFNHYGCLNQSRSTYPHICQLLNLLSFLHWLCLHRSGRSRRSRSRGRCTLQLPQNLRGNSPGPTSSHIRSNNVQPSATILCPAATIRMAENACIDSVDINTIELITFHRNLCRQCWHRTKHIYYSVHIFVPFSNLHCMSLLWLKILATSLSSLSSSNSSSSSLITSRPTLSPNSYQLLCLSGSTGYNNRFCHDTAYTS